MFKTIFLIIILGLNIYIFTNVSVQAKAEIANALFSIPGKVITWVEAQKTQIEQARIIEEVK